MENECMLCDKPILDGDPKRKLSQKSITNCVSASVRRKDGRHKRLRNYNTLEVHENCAKSYTSEVNIRRHIEQQGNSDSSPATRRKGDSDFDFLKLCLFCEGDASNDFIEKQKKREMHKRSIVRFVENNKTRQSIIDKLKNSNDNESRTIFLRISKVSDLVQVGARYHNDCFTKISKTRFPVSNDSLALQAAKFIADYMIERKNITCQFNMSEILSKFECNELPHLKHLKNHLKEIFGDDIVIHQSKDGPIITFADVGKKILTEQWYKLKKSNEKEEELRLIETCAKIIIKDVKSIYYDTNYYPAPNNFLENAKSDIPESLLTMLTKIITKDKKNPEKFQPQIIAIAHAIIALVRPGSFLSSMQVALATMLNRQYGSKELIQILNSQGFCCSYEEVQLFESSVLCHEEETKYNDGYGQCVFDNADHNVKTIDGFNTFHAMGGIEIITPYEAVSSSTKIKRVKKLPSSEFLGKFGKIHVKNFRKSSNTGYQNIIIKDLNEINPISMDIKTHTTDLFWQLGKFLLSDSFEEWNGTMEKHFEGCSFEASRIIITPFIRALPSKEDTIYTALLEADSKRIILGQKHIAFSFDQSLYHKAREIVECAKEELNGIIIRLGGFHTLMSFMGAIGVIMNGSGIREVFQTMYAENSVEKILSGHAYSRAVRGHILNHLALGHTILTSINMTDSELEKIESYLEADGDFSTLSIPEFKSIYDRFCNQLGELRKNGPTAKLWVQYFDMVSIMKQFIMAERLGDWKLHLESATRMLPYFHSSGHYLYAKSAHLYIQDMYELEKIMDVNEYDKFTKQGFFTVRRTDKFWSGIWTDMTIEQVLMRSMKSRGGLTRGRGITDSVLAKWVLTTPAVSEINDVLLSFCKISFVSSEQNVDARGSRISRDNIDLQKLLQFYDKFQPFKSTNKIQSITTGVQGNDDVNCHNAYEIGIELMKKMIGKTFNNIKFERKNRVVNLQSMKCIKVDNQQFEINPTLIFQRISVAMESDKKLKDFLAYELAPYPLSLFDNYIMRKSAKSKLYDLFVPLNIESIPNCCHVIDGGYLLHKVIWPQGENFDCITNHYVDYIQKHYANDSFIIFDGYPEDLSTSIKFAERQRRQNRIGCVEINFDMNMIPTVNQEKFFSNATNKNRFIQILRDKLEYAGFRTEQSYEGADYCIVSKALFISSQARPSVIVSEDIDVLVIYSQNCTSENVYFLKPSRGKISDKFYDTKSFIHSNVRNLIGFIHAFTGCDTTSAFYNKGKKKFVKYLISQPDLITAAKVFYDKNSGPIAISEAGEKIICGWYGGKNCPVKNLNELRYRLFKTNSKRKTFNISSLPPTKSAASCHSKRVYLTLQQWLGNLNNPLQWGWEFDSELKPKVSSDPLVPESILQIISCSCTGKCGNSCGCKKHGLKCNEYCKNCQGQTCENAFRINITDNDMYEESDSNIDLIDELEAIMEPDIDLYESDDESRNECEEMCENDYEVPTKKLKTI